MGGLEGLDYWERLSQLRLYSQERRRERYQIIYIWKVSQLLVRGYSLPFVMSPRRGWLVDIPPIERGSPAAVARAKEASIRVKGGRLFNSIPQELRNMNGVKVEVFKAGLDAWLATIPDQPTIPCRQREAATNSILDQVALLH